MKLSATAASLLLVALQSANAVPITLGQFKFESTAFGNTLLQSDGGAHADRNWLNIVNVNPGSPGYLTGANFNTGIANIGPSTPVTYTIGYTAGIANITGADAGVVAARYSADSFDISISTNSINFSSAITFPVSAGVATGVNKSYYYTGFAQPAQLYVYSLDFSSFGLASGAVSKLFR